MSQNILEILIGLVEGFPPNQTFWGEVHKAFVGDLDN
jgi:hypothetical protein